VGFIVDESHWPKLRRILKRHAASRQKWLEGEAAKAAKAAKPVKKARKAAKIWLPGWRADFYGHCNLDGIRSWHCFWSGDSDVQKDGLNSSSLCADPFFDLWKLPRSW